MQAVDDGDDTHLPCRIEHAFKRGDAFGTVPLEHGGLEFDSCGTAIGRLQHAHGIQFRTQRVDVIAPVSEELPMRVDADAQRAVFGH